MGRSPGGESRALQGMHESGTHPPWGKPAGCATSRAIATYPSSARPWLCRTPLQSPSHRAPESMCTPPPLVKSDPSLLPLPPSKLLTASKCPATSSKLVYSAWLRNLVSTSLMPCSCWTACSKRAEVTCMTPCMAAMQTPCKAAMQTLCMAAMQTPVHGSSADSMHGSNADTLYGSNVEAA